MHNVQVGALTLFKLSCHGWTRFCAGRLADGRTILVSLSYTPQNWSSCVLVCAVKVMKLYVLACRVEAGTKLNVGELGAHSLVDLVGIKVKRNVSKLERLCSTAV